MWRVAWAKCVGLEVRTGFQGRDGVDFGSESRDTEVVAPDLAGRSAS